MSIVTLSNQATWGLVQGLGNKNNSTVKKIRLSCCTLDDDDALKNIAKFLRRARGVQTLRVDSCRLSDEQLAALVKAVQSHTQLEEFYFPYNAAASQTIAALVDLIALENSQLKILDCGRQYDNHNYHKEYMDIGPLMNALRQHNTSLLTLNLSYSRVQTKDMLELAAWLSNETTTLETLYLCGNRLSLESIQALASTLQNNRSLQRLWLTGVPNFDSCLTKELCRGLRDNRALQEILLPPCLPRYYKEIEHYTDINKGGRNVFQYPSLPISLWPRLLERANCLKMEPDYYDANSHQVRRASIIFHLLKNRILLECAAAPREPNCSPGTVA
jgi:Ran GTPase-activating protein (RanGAP) involved in mRNA processing and transport